MREQRTGAVDVQLGGPPWMGVIGGSGFFSDRLRLERRGRRQCFILGSYGEREAACSDGVGRASEQVCCVDRQGNRAGARV